MRKTRTWPRLPARFTTIIRSASSVCGASAIAPMQKAIRGPIRYLASRERPACMVNIASPGIIESSDGAPQPAYPRQCHGSDWRYRSRHGLSLADYQSFCIDRPNTRCNRAHRRRNTESDGDPDRCGREASDRLRAGANLIPLVFPPPRWRGTTKAGVNHIAPFLPFCCNARGLKENLMSYQKILTERVDKVAIITM